jgi:hypothetical protein
MRRLGFANHWVHTVMTYVRTVSFSVLINGQPHGKIILSWGILQGDPLSPYFFIICVEGLSSLLNRAEVDGRITSFPISRRHEGKPLVLCKRQLTLLQGYHY